jgi:hypothetical protein
MRHPISRRGASRRFTPVGVCSCASSTRWDGPAPLMHSPHGKASSRRSPGAPGRCVVSTQSVAPADRRHRRWAQSGVSAVQGHHWAGWNSSTRLPAGASIRICEPPGPMTRSTIRWMRFQPPGPGELVHVLRALIGKVDGVLVAHHPTRTGPDQELVGGEARRRPGCIASPVAESMRPTRVVGAFSPVPWASAAGGRLGLVDLRTGIRERGHSCQWIVPRQEFGGIRRPCQRGRPGEHYR